MACCDQLRCFIIINAMEHPQFGGADLFGALQRGARSISLWTLDAHPHGDGLSVRKVVRDHPSTFDSCEES